MMNITNLPPLLLYDEEKGGRIMKEKNWSIALEHDEYEEDLDLVVRDAIEAVEETAKGDHERRDSIKLWEPR